MKRRGFLGAASVGLGVALWPAWLRDSFADEACDKPVLSRLAILAAAYRAAREAGKPLLVLVIPADDMAKWDRGQAFGELLNHADDKQLAPLSRVEVVCATMADLRKIVPNAGTGEPLMVLVSTDKVPAAARQLDVVLPAYAGMLEGRGNWEERGKSEKVISQKRIAAMAGLLRGALGADDARATALAAEVRKRLTLKPPRGARWAKSYGCGTTIEGEKDNMVIGCGMGHIPEASQRFLYFFTKRAL